MKDQISTHIDGFPTPDYTRRRIMECWVPETSRRELVQATVHPLTTQFSSSSILVLGCV